MAHQLQLALVTVSHEVILIHHFFTKLMFIENILSASCKCNDELKRAQTADIEHVIFIDEPESGSGHNQIGT